MATIRAYTTIEQSRKLAKILPIESADMYYFIADSLEKQEINYAIRCGTPIVKTDIPCWSLTTLLNILPDVHLKKYIYDGNTKYYVTIVGINQYNTNHYNNPIDACVEIIEKLHKLKKL